MEGIDAVTPSAVEDVSEMRFGKVQIVEGRRVKVVGVAEDSRCPVDVQCITAGRVVVQMMVDDEAFDLVYGDIYQGEGYEIEIVDVKPERLLEGGVDDSEYVFEVELKRLSAVPTVFGVENVSWDEVVVLIRNCEAEMVFQTHGREVTLNLKDGRQVRAIEPGLDDVFGVVGEAREDCGVVPLATE